MVGIDLSRFEIAICLDAIDFSCDDEQADFSDIVFRLHEALGYLPWFADYRETTNAPIFISICFTNEGFDRLDQALSAYLLDDDPIGNVEADLLVKFNKIKNDKGRDESRPLFFPPSEEIEL